MFTFNYPSRPPSAIRAMNADVVASPMVSASPLFTFQKPRNAATSMNPLINFGDGRRCETMGRNSQDVGAPPVTLWTEIRSRYCRLRWALNARVGMTAG